MNTIAPTKYRWLCFVLTPVSADSEGRPPPPPNGVCKLGETIKGLINKVKKCITLTAPAATGGDLTQPAAFNTI